MKHIIVYFPYALQKNPKSGSGVRPKRIVESFRKYGEEHNIEIIVISGNTSDRHHLIQEYKKSEKVHEALFCYMENSTVPYWLTDQDHIPRKPFMDMQFWKYLKKANIPIGLFYRDVYWQFDDMFAPPKNIKQLTPIMRAIFRKELKAYEKIVDILYLPSLEMNDFVGWTGELDELPPGMEQLDINKGIPSSPPKAVFVGGVSDQKGVLLMLEAFENINKDKTVLLELVCRKEEYERYPAMHKYEGSEWLTISHKSGKELYEVYQTAAIALIPRERNTYHDFSVPVKMFEYFSHGLPIVATNCKAHARIIANDDLGIITEEETTSFASGVLAALETETYKRLKSNVETYAYNQHSWYARVEKVAAKLARKQGGGEV